MAEQILMLKVISKVDGFRRGGRAWPDKPTLVAASEFTAEQLAQIRDENGKKLIVEELFVDAAAPVEVEGRFAPDVPAEDAPPAEGPQEEQGEAAVPGREDHYMKVVSYVNKCESIAELEKLYELDDRKAVREAISKRISELMKAEEVEDAPPAEGPQEEQGEVPPGVNRF